MLTRVRQQAQRPHTLRIKTLQLLKLSPYAVRPLQPQSSLLQIIAFSHHCQRAPKRIHLRVDTDCLRIRTFDYRRCLLRKSLRRTRKIRDHRRHLIPIVIELLYRTDFPSQSTIPETRVEPLRTDGGLALRSEVTVWMVAGARVAEPIHDVMTTVTGDQGVRISIAGLSVGQPPPVMMNARGTVTGTLGNVNVNERRIEPAESLIVSPLAGIATENEMLQAPDFLLVLLGILLGMIACNSLVTRQEENAPVTQETKKCAVSTVSGILLTPPNFRRLTGAPSDPHEIGNARRKSVQLVVTGNVNEDTESGRGR